MKNLKKIIALILALFTMLSLVACAAGTNAFAEIPPAETSETVAETPAATPVEPENEPPAIDEPEDALPPEGTEEPAPEEIPDEPEETPESEPEETLYSTGNPELDQKLDDLIDSLTSPDNSYEDNLHELYRYVRDNFGYRKKDMRTAENMEEWIFPVANDMIDEGAGNCYSFACLLYCLFRRYGFEEARMCVGKFCRSPHGWVEAEIDGELYCFDVETEYASLSRKRKPDRYVNCFYRTFYQLKQFSYVKEGDCGA